MTGHVSTLLLSGVVRLFLFLITTARDGVEKQGVRRPHSRCGNDDQPDIVRELAGFTDR
jgi:hypothetical protein